MCPRKQCCGPPGGWSRATVVTSGAFRLSTWALMVPRRIVRRSARSLRRRGGRWLCSRRPLGSSCRRPRSYRCRKGRFCLYARTRRRHLRRRVYIQIGYLGGLICDEFEGVVIWAAVFRNDFAKPASPKTAAPGVLLLRFRALGGNSRWCSPKTNEDGRLPRLRDENSESMCRISPVLSGVVVTK